MRERERGEEGGKRDGRMLMMKEIEEVEEE